MKNKLQPNANGRSDLIVRVPLAVKRSGSKKSVIAPLTSDQPALPANQDAFVQKLAIAHRWRARIESGEFATITELAQAERVNQSYACRILRLSLLAPEIIDAALESKLPVKTPARALAGFSDSWPAQTFELLD